MAWSTKCAETAFVVVVVLSSVFNIFWRINLLWNCCTSLHTALQYLCDGLFGFCTIACPWMERGWGFDMDERRAFWDILQLSTPFTHPSYATSVHWSTTHHSLPPFLQSPWRIPFPVPSFHITGDSGFRFQSLLMIYVTIWQHRLLPLGRIL